MAHLREYDYSEFDAEEKYGLLVLYFYWYDSDSDPALVIRLNTSSLSCSIERRKRIVSRLCICQELERLYLLLDEPYWKSFVRLTASRNHRIRNYELF